jgi:hypothetical protein
MMSGEMLSSSPAPQPGDILFAQKASSCVKAAGELPDEYSADGIYYILVHRSFQYQEAHIRK